MSNIVRVGGIWKNRNLKMADVWWYSQQDVDTLLTMIVPDSVRGPKAPNSVMTEMSVTISAFVFII